MLTAKCIAAQHTFLSIVVAGVKLFLMVNNLIIYFVCYFIYIYNKLFHSQTKFDNKNIKNIKKRYTQQF